jgi:O-antigen ligase
MFGFVLISVIWNEGNIIYFLNFFLLALGVLLLLGSYNNEERNEAAMTLIKTAVWFSVVASLLAVLNFYFYDLSTKMFFIIETPYYESKGQVGSFYPNPNLFGNMTAIISSLAVYLHKNRMMSLSKLLFFMFVFFLGVYFSGSRMALAVFLLSLLYLLTPRDLILKIRSGLILTVVYSLLIASTILFSLLGSYIDLNFRDVIWESVTNLFLSNPILGIGMANIPEKLYLVNSQIEQGQAANNFVLGFITENGLIAFILFSSMVISRYLKSTDLVRTFEVPVCFLFVSQFAESFYTYVGSYVILLIVLLFSNQCHDTR